MADPREYFPILKDGSDVGQGVDQAIDTVTDPSGLLGLIGFAFKNSSGKVVLPMLDPSGAIPVTDASGNPKSGTGTVAGNAALTTVTGASFTVGNSKLINNIQLQFSCRRAAYVEVQWVDATGPTTTVLYRGIVDAGQYTIDIDLGNVNFTSAAANVQTVQVQAKNFDKLSDFYATVSAREAP
jgi:hypothetical protein